MKWVFAIVCVLAGLVELPFRVVLLIVMVCAGLKIIDESLVIPYLWRLAAEVKP